MKPLSIFIVCIEPSGDRLASILLERIQRIQPITVHGVFGEYTIAAGYTPLFHLDNLSFFGFNFVKQFAYILKQRDTIVDHIEKIKPDILLTVDGPDFAYSVAKKVKQRGISSYRIHVVSPTVWAWRKGRAKKFEAIFHHMLAILPFEPAYYSPGFCDYVGHPALSVLHRTYKPKTNKGKTLGLFFGSRQIEIEKIITPVLKSVVQYHTQYDRIEILTFEKYKPLIKRALDTHHVSAEIYTDVNRYNRMGKLDFAIAVSGTATMELATLNIPQVIVYKASVVNYLIGLYLFLKGLRFLNIINILAKKRIIPEFLWLIPFVERKLPSFFTYIFNPQDRTEQIENIKPYILKLLYVQHKDADQYAAEILMKRYALYCKKKLQNDII